MASDAERVMRAAVADRLRQLRPHARIIHELNSAVYGPNRFDLAAVSPSELILVEIKSERDKLGRAAAQVEAMNRVGHASILALHRKWMVRTEANAHTAEWVEAGKHYRLDPPDGLEEGWRTQGSRPTALWVFPRTPETTSPLAAGRYRWDEPCGLVPCTPLSAAALNMLWAEELRDLCAEAGIAAGRRPNREAMMTAIRWGATGAQITRGICAALRRRPFAEADEAAA